LLVLVLVLALVLVLLFNVGVGVGVGVGVVVHNLSALTRSPLRLPGSADFSRLLCQKLLFPYALPLAQPGSADNGKSIYG